MGIDLEDSSGRMDLVPTDGRSPKRSANASGIESNNFNLTNNSYRNAYNYNPASS